MLLKSRIARSAISDWVAQATEERRRHFSHADDRSLFRKTDFI